MGEEGERYNLKNPGVKRILQEVKELQSTPNDDYMGMPLEDNLFEWQFAIRGPKDTEFEGGIYHGRIQLPPEYPFKPPAFMLLTPNGRFETQTKICLSISAHHPEHWQPSWSVRTALVALIAFMPTKPEGALGSLDYTKEERRALAIKSRDFIPKYGNNERQKLIDEIHAQMLRKAHPVPAAPAAPAEPPSSPKAEDDVTRSMQPVSPAPAPAPAPAPLIPPPVPAPSSAPSSTPVPRTAPERTRVQVAPARRSRTQSPGDLGLTLLAVGLAMAILGLLAKKLLKIYGFE